MLRQFLSKATFCQYNACNHSLLKQMYTYAYFDHYIGYLLLDHQTKSIISIDPGDEEAAFYNIKSLEQNTGYKLSHLLQTHGNSNHTYSSKSLFLKFPNLLNIFILAMQVIGPLLFTISQLMIQFHFKSEIYRYVFYKLQDVKKMYSIILLLQIDSADSFIIGITHVNSVSTKLPILFTGDTILISSIGKIDSGNYQTMYNSLQKIRGFPNETLIFPGHKVQNENLLLAKTLDPSNETINQKIKLLQEDEKQTLVPTSMVEERIMNPYMKLNDAKQQKTLSESNPVRCLEKLKLIQKNFFNT